MFPVFRAHPLLFQSMLSLILRLHDTDWTARAFSAAIGIATVALTFLLGRRLYGRIAGLIAGLLLAVMPYHVVVSRQVLLDGLMALCATAALYCVVRYVENGRMIWLIAGGSMMGAAILSKETSVILLGGLYAFFALTPPSGCGSSIWSWRPCSWWRRWRLAADAADRRAFPHRSSYLLWQLFRRPNHGTWFYFTTLPPWIGPAVLAGALAGLVWLRREATWRERLLLAWIAVPVLFFTLWPVKGFQYLLPIGPPLAVLAGRTLARPLPIWAAALAVHGRLHWPAIPSRFPAGGLGGSAGGDGSRTGRHGPAGRGHRHQPGRPGLGPRRAFRQRHLPGRQRGAERRPRGRGLDPAQCPRWCPSASDRSLRCERPGVLWASPGCGPVRQL